MFGHLVKDGLQWIWKIPCMPGLAYKVEPYHEWSGTVLAHRQEFAFVRFPIAGSFFAVDLCCFARNEHAATCQLSTILRRGNGVRDVYHFHGLGYRGLLSRVPDRFADG